MNCVVHDGDEPPCIPEINMILSKQHTGFPCPYRPRATSDDEVIVRLLVLATTPHAAHVYKTAFDLAFEDRPSRERRHRLEMFLAGLTDEALTRLIADQRAAASAKPKTVKES